MLEQPPTTILIPYCLTIKFNLDLNETKSIIPDPLKNILKSIMTEAYCNNDNQKRISILVTKEIHRSIKLHALNADQSMKDYIISLIMNQVNKEVLRE